MIGGQAFSYRFRERYTQRRVAMTPEELKEPWNLRQGRTTKVVRQDTGELILAIHAEAFPWHVKREWKDGPDRPLEAQLGEIVGGLEAMAESSRARQVEADAEARRRAVAERERYEAEQRRRRDENRFARLRKLAAAQTEAERVAGFVARCANSSETNPRSKRRPG